MRRGSLYRLWLGWGMGLLPMALYLLTVSVAAAPLRQIEASAEHVDPIEQFAEIVYESANITPAIGCYEDGASGKRVQVLYVHANDVSSRYTETLPLIHQVVAEVDAIFDQSAHETNSHRHVRYVHDSDCQLVVLPVELPAYADDSLSETVIALEALGYNQSDRKYLLFVEADTYCGIARSVQDRNPNPDNITNHKAGYAWLGHTCWFASAAAHELVHTLGGVGRYTPHSTGTWHCTDEHDLMCYPDSPHAPPMTYPCAKSHAGLLDCNHDDYFHTDPPADNYLATHWNVANSLFLSAEETASAQNGLSAIFMPVISR